MRVTATATIHLPIDAVVARLNDGDVVAAAVPGAMTIDGRRALNIHLGAMSHVLIGDVRQLSSDAGVWRLRARGNTLDSSGTAMVTASVRAVGDGPNRTRLEVDADLRLAGTIADSVGSVDAVVDRLVSDFAALLARGPETAVSSGPSISLARSPQRATLVMGALISGGILVGILRRFSRRSRP